MPVELTEEALRDALAIAGEWDEGGAQSARSALELLGWDGEGSMLLRRYDVQRFVWYTLPVKFLTTLEDKRETADVLARTLERIGGRAASYAEPCRAPETDELLSAWEAEDPGAWRRFRHLVEHSGLEPPDTELLAWGRVMGVYEARAREEVVTALERAVEAGELSPGSRGFSGRQAEVANRALREPLDGEDGRSRLQAVHAERLELWLRHGHIRGSEQRSAIIEPIVGLVASTPPPPGRAAGAVLAPALWLLDLAADGVPLTQTGALNRALVREATERWPGWWNTRIHGPPHRETDVALLNQLHCLLRRLRLLRRSGRRLVTTVRGRTLAADPSSLLMTIATDLLAGDDFRSCCAELAVALLLTGFKADWAGPLAERAHVAILAEGWQSAGTPPCVRDVSWAIADFIQAARAAGLIQLHDEFRFSREPLVLSDPGRAALSAGLRARALAPRNGPC